MSIPRLEIVLWKRGHVLLAWGLHVHQELTSQQRHTPRTYTGLKPLASNHDLTSQGAESYVMLIDGLLRGGTWNFFCVLRPSVSLCNSSSCTSSMLDFLPAGDDKTRRDVKEKKKQPFECFLSPVDSRLEVGRFWLLRSLMVTVPWSLDVLLFWRLMALLPAAVGFAGSAAGGGSGGVGSLAGAGGEGEVGVVAALLWMRSVLDVCFWKDKRFCFCI